MQAGDPIEAAKVVWLIWIAAAGNGGQDGGEEDIKGVIVWDTSAMWPDKQSVVDRLLIGS